MNAKQYHIYLGFVLLLVGVLGFFIIGPTAANSFFGENLFFNVLENWFLIGLGLVSLALGYTLPVRLQKWTGLVYGALFVFVGVYSFFSADLLGVALQTPADSVIYLVIGLWGLLIALYGKTRDLGKAKLA